MKRKILVLLVILLVTSLSCSIGDTVYEATISAQETQIDELVGGEGYQTTDTSTWTIPPTSTVSTPSQTEKPTQIGTTPKPIISPKYSPTPRVLTPIPNTPKITFPTPSFSTPIPGIEVMLRFLYFQMNTMDMKIHIFRFLGMDSMTTGLAAVI